MSSSRFPHLGITVLINGKPRRHGGGPKNPTSEHNKRNRVEHSNRLKHSISSVDSNWKDVMEERISKGLTPLPDNVIPLFLRINPDLVKTEVDLKSLKTYGLEIISELDDGYIIGNSTDGFVSLSDKIKRFIEGRHGGGKVADLWEVVDGHRWRVDQILSNKLRDNWDEMSDDEIVLVECGIACYVQNLERPEEGSVKYERKLEEFRRNQELRDEVFFEREKLFSDFISDYNGEITSSIVDTFDSFSLQLSICGKGLKDLVLNFPYLFEVSEVEDLEPITPQPVAVSVRDPDVELLPPHEGAVTIGIVDSGIQEGHRYLRSAICEDSRSYIDGGRADYVDGGHGTRVGGAVLFPRGIRELTGEYLLPFRLRNLRVLDANCKLPHNLHPPHLMSQIVSENSPAIKLYNLSINTNTPCRTQHMSAWPAFIDRLTYEKDILFIISAGNRSLGAITQELRSGLTYSELVSQPANRISSPAQSCFSITVGSVDSGDFDDGTFVSVAGKDNLSVYSRTGPGLWGMIKPEIVEFGGACVVSRDSLFRVRECEDLTLDTTRSTLQGGAAIGRDKVGTSYAAPRVANILGKLATLYPEESVNLYRCLLIQGARLPGEYFRRPEDALARHLGYGFPSIARSTSNSPHRVTLYNSGEISADDGHVFRVRLPREMRDSADEFDVLVEVTLSFTSEVRRTRRRLKSYLGTWLSWTSSKLNESFDDFQEYVLKRIDNADSDNEYDSKERKALDSFPWVIRERNDWGVLNTTRRNDSSIQKDWAILKSHQLWEDFSLAVIGHKGWDNEKIPIPYSIAVSFEILGREVEIYDAIRVENDIELEVEA